MASSSTSLSAYLFQRIKADLDFLHSQSLLDGGAREAIALQLDAAAARNGSGVSHGHGAAAAVPALSNQLSAVSFAPSPSPQPSNLSGPPAPPVRQEEHHDGRERARALWNYAATQPDDLSFQKGDIIVITQKENEHWFRGFVSTDPASRTGLFPSNHVEMISGNQSFPSQAGPDMHKGALQPYQHNMAAPPYHGSYQAPHYQPPGQHMQHQPQYHPPAPIPSPAEPAKQNKFSTPGSFKHTLATAAVGGASFGGASAAASSLVNAILH